jgi:indolepyruvate ferredoxin oxidoreductase beta subunit
MKKSGKIIITGVGGQGVLYLTEILVDAAVRANIPVATSEIHGLSQRGGSVTAGVTLGENTFGFVEEGGADFLLGLEILETQRCINYLHKESIVVMDNTKIFPHSVNSQKVLYPNPELFLAFLKKNIREAIFIKDKSTDILPAMRNLIVLAKAASHKRFPLKPTYIEEAIKENARENPEFSLKIFRSSFSPIQKAPILR